MRRTIDAVTARGVLVALIGALLLVAGPAVAEAKNEPQATRAEAALLAPGAGYSNPDGSERVRALQRRLRRAGERPGPIDGRFGPLTEAAVRRFQSREGLAVDGLVGEATGGALARQFAELASERRRAQGPRPAGFTAKLVPGAEAAPKASNEPGPGRAGKVEPTANPTDSGPELLGLGAMLAMATALALLLVGALVLAFGRPARRRHAGGQIDDALLTAPLRPNSGAPAALVSELPRPLDPKAGRPDGGRAPEHAEAPGGLKGTRVLGYASVSGPEASVNSGELREQAEVVAGECERRGLELLELVRDREPRNGKGLERPGLGYALGRISAGEASGVVVSELSRLSRSTTELGTILEWFTRSKARLVAVAQGLDTDERGGRITARTLIEVSGWERERLRERTHKGLQAARLKGRPRGRPAVADNPELRERIIKMRAEGMTLQAIADRLNEQGVPTVRGGAKWRPSSVQAAVGYKRPQRPRIGSLPGRQAESPPGEAR